MAGCQVMTGQTKRRALQQGFKDTQTQIERVTVNSNQYSLSETSLYQLLWITDAPTQALL